VTVAYVDYVSEDGIIAVGPTDAGFNGTQPLGKIRDHYGFQDLSDGHVTGRPVKRSAPCGAALSDRC
jgi:hypothetical protein